MSPAHIRDAATPDQALLVLDLRQDIRVLPLLTCFTAPSRPHSLSFWIDKHGRRYYHLDLLAMKRRHGIDPLV